MGKPNVTGAVAVLLAGTAALTGIQSFLDKKAPEPRPPHIRDVNGDGIGDLVLEKRARVVLGLFGVPYAHAIREEVYYGIRLSGGRTVYLPQEAFEAYKQNKLKLE